MCVEGPSRAHDTTSISQMRLQTVPCQFVGHVEVVMRDAGKVAQRRHTCIMASQDQWAQMTSRCAVRIRCVVKYVRCVYYVCNWFNFVFHDLFLLDVRFGR